MAFRDQMFRTTRIIKRLIKAPANFSEMDAYLKIECEVNDFVHNFSKKTFERDKAIIFSCFDVDIQYCNKMKKNFISKEDIGRLPEPGSSALFYLI